MADGFLISSSKPALGAKGSGRRRNHVSRSLGSCGSKFSAAGEPERRTLDFFLTSQSLCRRLAEKEEKKSMIPRTFELRPGSLAFFHQDVAFPSKVLKITVFFSY